jgi:hypothetical protein
LKNHHQTHPNLFFGLLQLQIHSYGSVYIFPWGYTNAEAPNHEAFQAALGKLEHLTDYPALGPGPDHYGAASGATDDFMYATMGALSMTWELGVNFHELCGTFEDMVPKHIKGLEYLSKIAPKPFLLSQGPDIINITVSPTVISEGVSLSITVKASDSQITEYFKDAPATQQKVAEIRVYMEHPLVNSTTLPIPVWSWNTSHIDWNSTDETLDTVVAWEGVLLARGAGDHTLYVQAVDTDGTIGPVEAVPLTVQASSSGASNSSPPTASKSPSYVPSVAPSPLPSQASIVPTVTPVTSRLGPSPDSAEEMPDSGMHITENCVEWNAALMFSHRNLRFFFNFLFSPC